MYAARIKILICLLSAAVLADRTAAQPKSVGTTWSFGGIGVSYEHIVSEDSFAEFVMKAEMSEAFLDRDVLPGWSASFSWNIIFKSWSSVCGNKMDFFAGPGISTGYTKEYKDDMGLFFGLKGRVGVECAFTRNAIISLCLAPIIGIHCVHRDGSVKLQCYKYGLIDAVRPEIGIRYCF